MPTRILREGIITSEAVNQLSERSELFYRRLMSVADDYGRFYAHPSLLRAACFPLKLELFSEADVKRMLNDCVAAGLLTLYGAGKNLIIENFRQQARGKSKFPEPIENELLIKCIADVKQMRSESESESYAKAESESQSNSPVVSEERTSSNPRKPANIGEAVAKGEFIGMSKEDSEQWYRDCEAADWRRGDGTLFDNWPRQQIIHRDRLRAGKGTNGAKKDLSPYDIKTIIEAKQREAKSLKDRHCSEVATGDTWQDMRKRDEYMKLMKEIRDLNKKLGNYA